MLKGIRYQPAPLIIYLAAFCRHPARRHVSIQRLIYEALSELRDRYYGHVRGLVLIYVPPRSAFSERLEEIDCGRYFKI
jgi:hypothetical protein